MPTLSKAQRSIAERIQAGGSLFLNPATGLYALKECGGNLAKVDQRPVEAMLIAGVLQQDLTGHCSLVQGSVEVGSPAFLPGQAAHWMPVVRGESKGKIDVVVINATYKQVRIKTAGGDFHAVRPSALVRT